MYTHLHARPAIKIEAPKLVTHLVYALKNNETDNQKINNSEPDNLWNFSIEVLAHFEFENINIATDDKDKFYNNFIQQKIGTKNEKKVIMQKHFEFFTFTFISNLDKDNLEQWCAIPAEIKQNHPLLGIHMRIETYNASENICYKLKELFQGQGFFVDDIYGDLYGSRISDEGALIWTPFREYKDQHSRVLIRNINLNTARLGRLVRRILEIKTYVFMALCNYNEAHNQISDVKIIQEKLTKVLSSQEAHKKRRIISIFNRIFPIFSVRRTLQTYKELEDIAKNVSTIISSTQFKFNASMAYAELVWQGIKELRETRVEGWSRIGYFLERNFRPAIRTCASAISCQNIISENVGQAAQLLESKVDLIIASVNLLIAAFLLFLSTISTIYYLSQLLHFFG